MITSMRIIIPLITASPGCLDEFGACGKVDWKREGRVIGIHTPDRQRRGFRVLAYIYSEGVWEVFWGTV